MPPKSARSQKKRNSNSTRPDPTHDNSHFPEWVNTFEQLAAVGIDSLRDNLNDSRREIKQAKLWCHYCGKEEESKKPLQFCSQCRTVHYCDRSCQVAHYKPVHKSDCTSFKNIPICRAFVMDRILPGCKYPESVVFAKGHEAGVGCWVSMAGDIDCGLFRKPGNPPPSRELDDNPKTMMDILQVLPGQPGSYLGMRILVQNRRSNQDQVVVIGNEILAVATSRGADVLLEGMKPGETHLKITDDGQQLIGLKPAFVRLAHFNGKDIKDGGTYPVLIDPKTCSVVLNRGDFAIFDVHFRVGGPRITLCFHALAKLARVQVSWKSRSTAATQISASVLADGELSVTETRTIKAPMDQSLVSSYYEDYRLHGKEVFIASHFGEARAKMIASGHDAMGMMMQMMMQKSLDSLL